MRPPIFLSAVAVSEILPYNTLYERLVDGSHDTVSGYVAYGIYKKAKREWLREFEARNERSPNGLEIDAYVATWTPQLIENVNDAAASALAEFAESVIADAQPGIVEDALKGSGVRSVLLSMLAALLYTVFLYCVALALKAGGIDLLGVLQNVGARH